MGFLRAALTLALPVALTAGCTPGAKKTGAGAGLAGVPAIVGVVDGEQIPQAAYLKALVEAQSDAFFPRYVERLLVEQAGQRAGIKIDEADLEKAVAASVEEVVKGRFGGKREGLETQLAKYGLTFDTWYAGRKREKRLEMIAGALMQSQIGDEQIKRLFEKRYGKDGVRRTVRHILVSTSVANSKFYTRKMYDAERSTLKAEARKLAEQLRGRIVGGADMAEIARASSDDFSASRGGDLGVNWSGRFGKAFDDLVAGLEVGKVGPVLEGRRGFHVVRVDGIRRGAAYEGRHILISARARGADDKRDEATRFADALKRAREIRKRVLGGQPFEQVAQKESDDPATKPKAGDLGKFGPGRLGGAVDTVLERLPLKSVSEPIKITNGYQLVWLESRTFQPDSDRKLVRHVLISTEFHKVKARRLKGKLEAMAKEKAQALLGRVTGGEAFEKVAEAASEDELTRRKGGELRRYRAGRLGKAADAALASMKPGDVRLVKSRRGYHIIKLDAETRAELPKVRAELKRELQNKKPDAAAIKRYIQGLREKAKIEKLI